MGERTTAEELDRLSRAVEQLEKSSRLDVAEHREITSRALQEIRQSVDALQNESSRTQTLAESVVERYDKSLASKAWELFAECIKYNGATRAWAGIVTLLCILVWSTALAMKFVNVPEAVRQVQQLVNMSQGMTCPQVSAEAPTTLHSSRESKLVP